MGLSDDDLDRMDSEMENIMELATTDSDEEDDADGPQGKTPPIDF